MRSFLFFENFPHDSIFKKIKKGLLANNFSHFSLGILLTIFSLEHSQAFTKYNYRWDGYGLCARYHPDTGSFHGYAHFYCNPSSLNPDVQGASMNRVFKLKGSRQTVCGEFTAGAFFAEKDEAGLTIL